MIQLNAANETGQNPETQQILLIHSFFEFNDLPYCVEMNNFFLNEIFAAAKAGKIKRSEQSGLVLFNTQLTTLLVSLHELERR